MNAAAVAMVGVLGLGVVLLGGAGSGGATPGDGETVTKVTLKRHAADGAYGKSAYSFRYASQDLAVHHNYVEIVYGGCGQLHISPYGGSKNRIVRVDAKRLQDVKELPKEGWLTECAAPEKGSVYVLQIEDEDAKASVKFGVTELSEKELKFEWAPFADPSRGQAGTMGRCLGPHECQ